MLQKFKKGLCLAGAAAMFCMAGCGPSGSDSADGTVIDWYMPKAIDNLQDQEMVEQEANKIISEQTGATLKFHFVDSASYNDKMNVVISSGEDYDVCFTSSWANNYLQNIKKNAFMEISDLLETKGQDILAKADPRVIEALKTNGELYAIPSQVPLSTLQSRVLKKELVEKYNFDYQNAQSLASLEPFLEQIKQNEPGITPLLVQGSSPIAPYFPEQRYNDDTVSVLRFDEQTKQYVKYFEIPEVIEHYRLLHDYYQKGYIANDAATQTEYMAEAKSGRYAVMNGVGYYTEDASKSTAAYGFPCVETLLQQDMIATPSMMTAMNAISYSCKDAEKAMEVINLIWKDTNLSNMLAYGIEGVNYTVDSRDEAGQPVSVTPKSGNEQTWALWHNWIGPLWDQWDSDWNRKESLQQMQEVNETAEVSGAFGFVFDSDPVKTELAQLTNVYSEISPIFNTGSMPDFDAYLQTATEKLESVGIDKVLDEINRQYAEWAAKK